MNIQLTHSLSQFDYQLSHELHFYGCRQFSFLNKSAVASQPSMQFFAECNTMCCIIHISKMKQLKQHLDQHNGATEVQQKLHSGIKSNFARSLEIHDEQCTLFDPWILKSLTCTKYYAWQHHTIAQCSQ